MGPSGIPSLLSALATVLASTVSQVDNPLPHTLASRLSYTSAAPIPIKKAGSGNTGFPLPIPGTQIALFHSRGLSTIYTDPPLRPPRVHKGSTLQTKRAPRFPSLADGSPASRVRFVFPSAEALLLPTIESTLSVYLLYSVFAPLQQRREALPA